ncbi:hypothetical protein ABES25_24035 [Bacillus gobiensis]|uniref:hypothetical protein n=1 Tax=Bacillus gobiensis TaxID=1441095 RepID=UPI003D1B8E80
MKFKVFIEKEDQWHLLGTFEGIDENEALISAKKSEEILTYFNKDELDYVNLELEKVL